MALTIRAATCTTSRVTHDRPVLRLADLEDVDAIDALMKASIAAIFPRFYDATQTAASVKYIGSVDRTLIEDTTYFVLEADREIVACGGWSRRDKLYTGSGDAAGDARRLDPETEPARIRAMFVRDDWTRRGLGTRILEACESAAREEGFRTLALVATLPGLLLYERYGFVASQEVTVTIPDGTTVAAVAMEKPIK
jgi:GNAT superfamily N-acetyltransferase